MEQTLVFIKPDGVRRGIVGEIISRIERAGLKIVALEMRHLEDALTRHHYVEHAGRAYFNDLIDFVTSGPVVLMVVEGEEAIETMRRLMGATDPARAEPGTIRADFGTGITENVIHGSDSGRSAFRELRIFFPGLA